MYPFFLPLPSSSFFFLLLSRMGTRGYYIFRYKNKYYIFYNHFDSYFTGLGANIVKELRSWKTEDFENAKAFLLNFPLQLSPVVRVSKDFNGLMEALRSPMSYTLEEITDSVPPPYIHIEYRYTLDFDRNLFIVEWWGKTAVESQRYRLTGVPEDWIELTGCGE